MILPVFNAATLHQCSGPDIKMDSRNPDKAYLAFPSPPLGNVREQRLFFGDATFLNAP